MATTQVPDHVDEIDDDADAHGGRIRQYVGIAIFLAVLTAIEVATFYFPDFPAFGGAGSTLVVAVLLILMAVKFWTVTWFFMHLKFDKRLLTVVFYAGLALAVVVYIAVLALFRFFGPPADHMVPH